MLLAIDFDDYLIAEESVAAAPVFAFQSTCINGSEFDAPETERLAEYSDALLGE